MSQVIAACGVRGSMENTDKDLKAALINWLPTAPRRIDRLILQALLCTAPLRTKLNGACGLYLASRHPARGTMGSLLDTVCVHQLQPKPFEFVNSVSNAAGFHVAAQLGLEGPNLFIGSGPNVWKHLQALASLDLADSLIDQALLVMIDEDDEFEAQAVLIERPSQAADFAELTAEVDVLQLQL